MTGLQFRFTWHLRAPFKRMFDNSHWWKGQENDIEPEAAAYELARRHPRVQEGYKLPGQTNPTVFLAPIACLRDIGLKPWTKLKEREKASWKQCMGSIKGVDMRPDSRKCYSVTRQALAIAHVSATRDFGFKDFKPPRPELAELCLKMAAWGAEMEGCLLIAIAPDLAQDEAASLLAREYQRHRKSTAAKPRARAGNWLDLIASFEDSLTSPPKGVEAVAAANENFKRYRRVMESLAFSRRHWAGTLMP